MCFHSVIKQRALQARVEELKAFLDRAKQLHEGPDSATNMEYLKNCVFKFMSSVDASEKRRLYPVIATILKLTSQEMKQVEYAFNVSEQRENELQSTLTSIGSFATSSLGSFW
jgi:cob(I)alamin adenosyltransferase